MLGPAAAGRALMAFNMVAGSTLRVSTAGRDSGRARARGVVSIVRQGACRLGAARAGTHKRRAAPPPTRAARRPRRWLRKSRWPGRGAREERRVRLRERLGRLGASVARRARGPAAARAAGPARGAGLRAGAAQRTSTRQMSKAVSPRNRRLAEGASLAAVTARARLPSVSAAAAGLGHAPRAQPNAPSGAAAARRPRHARAFIRGACQLLLERSLLAVAQLLRVLHQQHLRTGRRRVSGGAMPRSRAAAARPSVARQRQGLPTLRLPCSSGRAAPRCKAAARGLRRLLQRRRAPHARRAARAHPQPLRKAWASAKTRHTTHGAPQATRPRRGRGQATHASVAATRRAEERCLLAIVQIIGQKS